MQIILPALALLAVIMVSIVVAYLVISVRRLQRQCTARGRLRALAAMDTLGPDLPPPELRVVRTCGAVGTAPTASPRRSDLLTAAALVLAGVAALFVVSSSGSNAPDVARPSTALPAPAVMTPAPADDTAPPTTTPDTPPAPTTQLDTTPTPHAGEQVKLQTTPRSSRPGKLPTVPTSDSQTPLPRQEPLSSSSTPTPPKPSLQPLCAGTIHVQSLPVGCSIG